MALKMPDGKRCAACFTFDVDGMIVWISMRMVTKATLSRGDDFSPYKLRLGDKVLREEPYTIEFGQECPLLEFPWHWDQDDFPHFEFFSFYLNPRNPFYAASPLSSYKKVKEVWLGSFDWMYENVPGGLHHSVLHPQVSGLGQRIKFLEEVMQYITAKPDVWVAPLIDLARAWQD